MGGRGRTYRHGVPARRAPSVRRSSSMVLRLSVWPQTFFLWGIEGPLARSLRVVGWEGPREGRSEGGVVD